MKLTFHQKVDLMATGFGLFFMSYYIFGIWFAPVTAMLAVAAEYYYFKRGLKLSDGGEKLLKRVQRIIWAIAAIFAALALIAGAYWYFRYGRY
jgi:hypothetical protein